MTQQDDEMRFALNVLDDHRRLIAAGKVHRWEIVKWAVTINIALAGASVTLTKIRAEGHAQTSQQVASPQLLFFLLAVLVFALTICLIWEATRRMTAARNDGRKTLEYLVGKQINIKAVTGREVPSEPYPRNYDWQETLIYIAIVLASVAPALAMWLFFRGH